MIAVETPSPAESLALYRSVGWTAYTADPERLVRALRASHTVLTARQDGRLVGLTRTVSDGQTVCYVQDLLVDPAVQRQGVGRSLMEALLDRYRDCRAFVLTTDDDGTAAPLYRAVGLRPHAEHGLVAYWRG